MTLTLTFYRKGCTLNLKMNDITMILKRPNHEVLLKSTRMRKKEPIAGSRGSPGSPGAGSPGSGPQTAPWNPWSTRAGGQGDNNYTNYLKPS